VDHAKDVGQAAAGRAVMWFKATVPIIAHNGNSGSGLPRAQRPDDEGELTVVIGKRCKGRKRGGRPQLRLRRYDRPDISERTIQNSESQMGRRQNRATRSADGDPILHRSGPVEPTVENAG